MEPNVDNGDAGDLRVADDVKIGIAGPMAAMLESGAGRRITIEMSAAGYVVWTEGDGGEKVSASSPVLPLALYAAYVRSGWL